MTRNKLFPYCYVLLNSLFQLLPKNLLHKIHKSIFKGLFSRVRLFLFSECFLCHVQADHLEAIAELLLEVLKLSGAFNHYSPHPPIY